MSDTKWADVAHYYLRSGIKCNVYRGDLTERRGDCKQTVETFGVKHLRVAVDSMTFGCVPILRCIDDMTEVDAMSLWKSVANRVAFDDSVYAAYGSPLVIYRSKFKALQPEEFHCAIQLGFDVFGLIESGQAIRKEMGNG